MADQFTMRSQVLRRQYQYLTTQLDLLYDQYDTWKVRYQRAIQQHHKVFQLSLHLRLITLDGIIQNIQDMIQNKANELVIEVSITGDLELLEELGIEVVL
jgi:hypothetical protein